LINDFTYLDSRSVKEAIELRAKYPEDSTFVAGGTNLLYLMKRGVRKPKYLINIKSISGLDSVRFDAEGLTIGSLVRLDKLQYSEVVNTHYPMIAQSVGKIASPQIRNVATVGGNLSQEVWCWYLTEGFDCWMNGGRHCFAPEGDNRYHHSVAGGFICQAIHPSDLAPTLYALDARVNVAGPNNERKMGIDELLPGFTKVEGKLKQNILKSDELIVSVHVPVPASGSRSIFLKYAARESFDFSLASVALNVTFEGETIKDLRAVLGGVATKPLRASNVETTLKGKRASLELLQKASENVFDKELPLSMNSYRIRLTRELVRRALFEVCGLEQSTLIRR